MEFKMAMDEFGEGGIWETIKNGNKEELEEKIERGIRIKTDQEIQHDWDKIDKSKFCKQYKNRKDGIEMEKYWEDKEIRGEIRETWARLRCGSIGRERNKGFKDGKCRLCKVDDETLVHICRCSEVQRAVQEKVVDGLKEWVANDSGDDLERKIDRELSMGKPVIALCEYVAEFERVALKDFD